MRDTLVAKIIDEYHIAINKGSDDGFPIPFCDLEIHYGGLVKVYDPQTEEFLGECTERRVKVKIVKTFPKFSICELLEEPVGGIEVIKVGDKVTFISIFE